MSWDIFIYNFPKEAKTPDDIPKDWRPTPLGDLSTVTAKIKAAVPKVNFDSPHSGVVEGKGYTIEVYMGNSNTVIDVMLSVHGGGGAVQDVSAIVSKLGARAIDSGTGGFFEPGTNAVAGYNRAAQYTQHVLATTTTSQRPSPIASVLPYAILTLSVALIIAGLLRPRRKP